MSAQARQESNYMLILSGVEREALLTVLRRASAETLAEAHRAQGADLNALAERLERLDPNLPARSQAIPVEAEEGVPLIEELYIDESGRFQMTEEDLEDFLPFLRDHEVCVDLEAKSAFRSGGSSYAYGRLAHPYDIQTVGSLYRTWRLAHLGRATAMA